MTTNGPDGQRGAAARGDRPVMTLPEFKEWFVVELEWSPPEIDDDDDLIEDLGMDSVGAVSLIVGLEEAVGGAIVMPIELILEIRTVRDVYLQYCALASLPLDPSRAG